MAPGKQKVIVAMSGGVDSSVAAALLLERGYEVIGVTMRLGPAELEAVDGLRTCCGLGEVEDARRVAEQLGFPHYALDFRQVFRETVLEPFIAEYARGRTPNPCIRCNEHVKFTALLHRAEQLGVDYVATGHYARVGYDAARGRWTLRRGLDARKDQSYVLYPLRQEQLARTLLPLGDRTKEETRLLAEKMGLPIARKPESQEVCFIPDHDVPRFLRERRPETAQPGPILDRSGKVLGEHPGVAFYTIGQRRRLGVSAPEPLYVVDIDPERNTITVDTWAGSFQQDLVVDAMNYLSEPPWTGPREVLAQVRYNMAAQPATVVPLSEQEVWVRFREPQRAITPGQAAVFYEGDWVLGGGTIREVEHGPESRR